MLRLWMMKVEKLSWQLPLEKKKLSKKSKIDIASIVGKRIGSLAKKAGVSQVKFDRGGYLYHGRVKSLAEGAREGGLKF